MNEAEVQQYLNEQVKEADEKGFDGEKLPALILEEGKLTTFEIILEAPFDQWTDPNNGAIKKIIKVKHEGVEKNFWLNVANPCYKSILEQLKSGNKKITIMRTGTQANTKYNLVDKY